MNFKNLLSVSWFALLMLAFILAIIGSQLFTETPSQNAAIPNLTFLPEADTIVINDEWSGLSPVSPIAAHYSLQRKDKEFKGQAKFSAGSQPRYREAMREVAIPLNVAQSALTMLSQVPFEQGEYQPAITHTDDYPSIEITLETPTGQAQFFTQSQGKDHVPWSVQTGRRTWVVRSNLPAKALEKLEPYLHREVLESLIQDLKTRSFSP